MYRVKITAGADQGRYYDLNRGESCLIGRDSSACCLVLSDNEVSRQHLKVEVGSDGTIAIEDLKSSNGVFLSSGRIDQRALLREGEPVTIGSTTIEIVSLGQGQGYDRQDEHMTRAGNGSADSGFSNRAPAQYSRTLTLGPKTTIGRDPSNDIALTSPRVSRFHAQIESKAGQYYLEDLNSTNGTYADGKRVDRHYLLQQGSVIQISGYQYLLDGDSLHEYDETGGQIRIELRNLSKVVPLANNEARVILDDISLTVEPCEFVAILGGSGAGKSTLLKALMGSWPATEGEILFNGRNFYQNYGAYQSQIGYVPQDDIVHMELTVEEVLEYAARLRMPGDTTGEERAVRVNEVMDVLELSARRNNQVKTLSGGQRKRVSIGVELLTKPGLFFLDEPTSGLDPGLEKLMMEMMKKLARQGQTIFLVTHATFNIHLCDKIIFLTEGGKLAFYGTPKEALHYFGTSDFAEIYKKIAMEETPMWWKESFLLSEPATRYLPRGDRGQDYERDLHTAGTKTSSLKQWAILTSRYNRTVFRDRKTLSLLVLQPVVIAAFCALVFFHAAPIFDETEYVLDDLIFTEQVFMENRIFEVLANQNIEETRLNDMLMMVFILVISSIWLGASNAAREIVKEAPIYKRERLVNLRIAPYLFSKIAVLTVICIFQTLIFLAIIKFSLDLPHFWFSALAFFMITLTSVMMGLMISSIAATANSANAAIPILLVPQMLLSGVLMPMEMIEPEIFQPVFYLAISKWGYEILGGDVLGINDLVAMYEPIDALKGEFTLHWIVLGLFILIFYLGSSMALIRKDRDLS